MASKLEGFSFGFPDGTERRGVDGCDNVVWDDGKRCVAVVYQGDSALPIPPYRLDYGDEKRPEHMAGFYLKHNAHFEEFDPLALRCIALEWIATYGGNEE